MVYAWIVLVCVLACFSPVRALPVAAASDPNSSPYSRTPRTGPRPLPKGANPWVAGLQGKYYVVGSKQGSKKGKPMSTWSMGQSTDSPYGEISF
ncbi:hypothetical protein PCANC_25078 [Puccinia coronata f. sp. avenae]|uniref:Secreted protein n=1 Tax=Puccinia coronata f. sp. avenae TaxID=200324 RepID=A0A2N5TMH8_9BASI|nr:hypothetical protein PCANC_25078 [Puccinia coronata f. sp. avenae]PLW26705.1 hypothetical protein PCASD_20759 [Puccinia coronata f. sp. avenae]PLW28625.1 hypothetical protein PCASD_21184 [Puccinia coronata f. sp. avenae]